MIETKMPDMNEEFLSLVLLKIILYLYQFVSLLLTFGCIHNSLSTIHCETEFDQIGKHLDIRQ